MSRKASGIKKGKFIAPIMLMAVLASVLVVMGAPAAAAVNQYDYHFTWYDNNPSWGMNGDWIIISNRGAGSADVKIEIGGSIVAVFDAAHGNAIAPGAEVDWQSPSTLTNGPVVVTSLNGEPLGVSQRVLFKDSFNELNAVRGTDLEDDYYFTWYDNNHAWGMNGNWICVTNPGSQPTTVNIFMGDVSDIAAPVATVGPIPAGGHVEWQSPVILTSGPVRVRSNNGEPLLVSQRVIYKDSFSEVSGVASSRLGGEALFPWYDYNPAWGMNGNWLLVANLDSFDAARVEINIGGEVMKDPLHPGNGFFIIGPGEQVTPQFLGVFDGPVRVTCQNCYSGQKLIISQRTIYKNSFEEIQGISPVTFAGVPGDPVLGDDGSWTYPIPVPGEGETVPWVPGNDISNNAWFNWYDSNPGNGMMGDWVCIGNTSAGSLDVKIRIGGSYRINPATGTEIFTVGGGDVITPSFPSLTAGPVSVECQNCTAGQKLVISQRVIYKNSFNEVVGKP